MGFRITFLGTGGGRHTTMYQVRSTGGMLIEHDGRFLHVDPGPGALTQMHRIRYDLTRTDSVIVSHCHPDHYSDAESVIEGMTRGGWTRRGSLYGSQTVLRGNGRLGPCISDYHQGIVSSVSVFEPGDVLDVDGMRVDICRADHSDPTNVGFRFHTDAGIVSYVSDTECPRTLEAFMEAIHDCEQKPAFPVNGIQIYTADNHTEACRYLTSLDRQVNLAILRGTQSFVADIVEHARVPVLKRSGRLCHVFVDGDHVEGESGGTPEKLINWVAKQFGVVKIRPDQKLFIERDLQNYATRVETIKTYVGKLVDMVKGD